MSRIIVVESRKKPPAGPRELRHFDYCRQAEVKKFLKLIDEAGADLIGVCRVEAGIGGRFSIAYMHTESLDMEVWT